MLLYAIPAIIIMKSSETRDLWMKRSHFTFNLWNADQLWTDTKKAPPETGEALHIRAFKTEYIFQELSRSNKQYNDF